MDWLMPDHVPQRREPPAPKREATLFRAVGKSERPIVCATYLVATGVELRLGYEDNEFAFLQTQLFRPDEDEGIAEKAAEWRSAFDRVGGFKDLGILD